MAQPPLAPRVFEVDTTRPPQVYTVFWKQGEFEVLRFPNLTTQNIILYLAENAIHFMVLQGNDPEEVQWNKLKSLNDEFMRHYNEHGLEYTIYYSFPAARDSETGKFNAVSECVSSIAESLKDDMIFLISKYQWSHLRFLQMMGREPPVEKQDKVGKAEVATVEIPKQPSGAAIETGVRALEVHWVGKETAEIWDCSKQSPWIPDHGESYKYFMKVDFWESCGI